MSYAEPVRGNEQVYGGRLMRSDLEVRLASVLDAKQIHWLYETHLNLTDGRLYLPDFTIVHDPSGIVGAQMIEVKNHKHVLRCANTLGLSNGRTQAELCADKNWTQPVPISSVVHLDNHWDVFKKPIIASSMGYSVLLIGKPSMNGSVILLRDGWAWARRTHPLVGHISANVTIKRHIVISGCGNAHKVSVSGSNYLPMVSSFDGVLGEPFGASEPSQVYMADVEVQRHEILKVDEMEVDQL